MKKYFIVIAKCGHVGKGKYIEVEFPTISSSKTNAAKSVLQAGKVKKQLKNAISAVYEVNKEEYLEVKERFKNDSYIHSHYKKEVSLDSYDIQSLELENKIKTSFNNRTERVKYYLNKLRLKSEVYDYDFNY